MHIAEAQREIRQAFQGGFAGQTVSGLLWTGSAAAATWGTPRLGILVLVVGGVFIYPATLLMLALMRRPVRLDPANTLPQLATQVAFTIPLALPVVGAATLHRLDWFYPATMVIVGAHYLPFVFLYGMPAFAALGGAMIAGGVLFGLTGAGGFADPGWATGAALLVFAAIGRAIAAREAARGSGAAA